MRWKNPAYRYQTARNSVNLWDRPCPIPSGITVECQIYRLLATLSHAGYRLLTATSKPEVFAIQILEYFHIRRYFSFVAGATMDGSRSSKCDVISYALSSAKISDPSCAIMIGDRKYDILGARQCGLSAIGVLYGYGSRRELEAAGADYLAATVSDIYPVFISEK